MGKGSEVGPARGHFIPKPWGFLLLRVGPWIRQTGLWESALDGGQAGDSSAGLGVVSGFSLDL